MDWAGWALFGLLATAALTAIMIAAQLAGLDPSRPAVAARHASSPRTPTAPVSPASSSTWRSERASRSATPRLRAPRHGDLVARRPVRPAARRASRSPCSCRCLPGSIPAWRPIAPGRRRRPCSSRPGLLGLNYGAQTPAVAVVAHLALRHRARPAAHGRLSVAARCPTTRPDRGLRAHRRHPHRGARRVRRRDRLDVRPRFDGAPVFGRLVGGAGARARSGWVRRGRATVVAPSLPPGHRHPGDDVGAPTAAGSRSPKAMVAEVAGALLPDDAARAPARPPTAAPVDGGHRLRPSPRRTTTAPPRVEHRGDVLVCAWGALAVALAAAPSPLGSNPAGRRRSPSRRASPLTLVLAVADREPLVYVDPDTAWAALEADEQRWRAWSDDDRPTTLPHREMPSCAACSRCGC